MAVRLDGETAAQENVSAGRAPLRLWPRTRRTEEGSGHANYQLGQFGPHRRREFLRAGLAGFGTLSLPGLFRLRAEAAAAGAARADGGDPRLAARRVQPPGHLRPQARRPVRVPRARSRPSPRGRPASASPSCCRGTPAISDRFTLLRSMAHTGGGHPAGSLQLLSGDPDPQDKLKPVYPDFMSVAHHLRFDPRRPLPNYVGVNPIARYDNFTIAGPAYLGRVVRAVRRDGRPERPELPRPEHRPGRPRQATRCAERAALCTRRSTTLRRELDRSGAMRGDGPLPGPGARPADQPGGGAGVRPEPASRQGARPLRPQRLGPAAA